jgi:hypothetical protein
MFDTVQGLILLVVWVVTFAIKGFAFIDCLRRPADAFPAVSRQTKPLWLILTGLAAATGFFPSLSLTIFGLAALVIGLVYVFDIRPRIIDVTSRRW